MNIVYSIYREYKSMPVSEKHDLIIHKIQGIKDEVQNMRKAIQ